MLGLRRRRDHHVLVGRGRRIHAATSPSARTSAATGRSNPTAHRASICGRARPSPHFRCGSGIELGERARPRQDVLHRGEIARREIPPERIGPGRLDRVPVEAGLEFGVHGRPRCASSAARLSRGSRRCPRSEPSSTGQPGTPPAPGPRRPSTSATPARPGPGTSGSGPPTRACCSGDSGPKCHSPGPRWPCHHGIWSQELATARGSRTISIDRALGEARLEEAGPRPSGELVEEHLRPEPRRAAGDERLHPLRQPGRRVGGDQVAHRVDERRAHLPREHVVGLRRREPEAALGGDRRRQLTPGLVLEPGAGANALVVEVGDEPVARMTGQDLVDEGRPAATGPDDERDPWQPAGRSLTIGGRRDTASPISQVPCVTPDWLALTRVTSSASIGTGIRIRPSAHSPGARSTSRGYWPPGRSLVVVEVGGVPAVVGACGGPLVPARLGPRPSGRDAGAHGGREPLVIRRRRAPTYSSPASRMTSSTVVERRLRTCRRSAARSPAGGVIARLGHSRVGTGVARIQHVPDAAAGEEHGRQRNGQQTTRGRFHAVGPPRTDTRGDDTAWHAASGPIAYDACAPPVRPLRRRPSASGRPNRARRRRAWPARERPGSGGARRRSGRARRCRRR